MTHAIESLEPRRHLSAGDLDSSFGAAGTVSLRNGIPATHGTPDTAATDIVVDHGGRPVVVSVSYDHLPGNGGQATATTVLTRLLPDGRPDPRFAVATGGSVVAGSDVQRVAVDSQNRIYVLSYGDITRYTVSGRIDRTYGTGGTVVYRDVAGDTDVIVADITIGPRDVLWAFTEYSSEVSSDAAIEHLSPDGRLIDGVGVPYATVTAGDVQSQYKSITPGLLRTLADGSVVAVAHTSVSVMPPGGVSVEDEVIEQGVTALKFKPSGRPDRSYGKRGQYFAREITRPSDFAAGFLGDVLPIGIADDGSVLLRDLSVRPSARNTLITPAGRSGVAAFGPTIRGGQLLAQPDGRRLVLDTTAKTLRRFNADGTPGTTFNHGDPIGGVSAIAFGPADTLLITGTGRDRSDTRYVVRRIEL